MSELTEQQKKDYWRYNLRLTMILLAIWFVVTYLLGGLFAGALNEVASSASRSATTSPRRARWSSSSSRSRSTPGS